MIKTVIVDDERKGAHTLSKLLEMHCPQIRLCAIALSADEALLEVNKHKPDLVFLDIEMPVVNGFEFLSRFPKPEFKLIFVTAHSQYAIRGYKHSAIDYLLKPIDADELKAAVEKVSLLVKEEKKPEAPSVKNEVIEISDSNGIIYIPQSDIIRLQANGAYTCFFCENNVQHVVSYNIKKYEDKLDTSVFMRVHKSHIINLTKVKKFQRSEGFFAIMKDGSRIEVARRLKDFFSERMQGLS